MSVQWYYVRGESKVGPVDQAEIESLYGNQTLNSGSYVWRKGFTDWEKIKNTSDLSYLSARERTAERELPPSFDSFKQEIDWAGMDENDQIIHIKIGHDRGAGEVEYGPFSITQLKRAYNEHRINEKSYIFTKGMKNWDLLGDTALFSRLTSQTALITEKDRRKNVRRPMTAKIMFHDNSQVYDGICRDISVGGMQVLVSNFPGKVGEKIMLNIHPDNSEYCFTASGEVIRLLEGNQGLSLRFSALEESAHKAISSYIENN